MNIQILLFILSIMMCVQGYKHFMKEEYNISLIYILLLGSLLRLLSASDPFVHCWDERYHFLVAKNLCNNWMEPKLYAQPLLDYDYKQWGSNHIWLHKPPFALWMIALSFKILGVSEFTGRLPSFLGSIAGIYLTFQIAMLLLNNKKAAIRAAFLHAINGIVIELSTGRDATDHIDSIFFFILELALYLSLCYDRKKNWVLFISIGILTGTAVLTKWYVGLFIIPMFFLANVQKNKIVENILKCIVLFIIALPLFYSWQVYTMSHFPNEALWEKSYNFKHLFEPIEGHGHAWWYHIDKARIIWNELIYVIFAWFATQWFLNPFQKKYYFLGIWIVIPYIIFSISVTKMTGYLLFTAPAFFIMIGLFITQNDVYLAKNKYLKYLPIIILLLSIRYSMERVKPFQNVDPLAIEKNQILEYKNQISNPKTVIFNAKNFIEVMFYTDFVAYEKLPSPTEIENVKKQGYEIAIVKSDNIPNYILNDTHILKL
jgi:4-amino-4-deoxy-L-arabinose transferase-like glycosyltransferase